MGLIKIMGRGDELREFKKYLSMAKRGIEGICELSEDMEGEYSERGSMSMRDDYSERDDYDASDIRKIRKLLKRMQ